jgi:thymidylate synthase
MNSLDLRYQKILQDILLEGKEKGDRTGTGTISVFGKQIRHDMSEGFPLLTTKKMAIKTMMTELKWFLKGDTNIKYLVDNGCNIWNGDAYKNYCKSAGGVKEPDYTIHIDDPNNNCTRLMTQKEFIEQIKTDDEFANKWGDLGRIYGAQWREWIGFEQFDNHAETIYVDQIANLIRNIKENPDSRRLMVTAWNPSELHQVVLPPCHYGFQCYVNDGKLSLMWNQRSVDTFLGLPFNIASYGTLLLLLCEETNLEPGELIGNLGDTHLYKNHIEHAEEQRLRSSFTLPTIKLSNVDILSGEWDYEIEGYEYHPTIKAPLSN